MRLPWISQRQSSRSATRRKRSAPLRVRRLERRRVLDAAVTDLVFAPADVDGATAVHDSNEGAEVTVTADATGSGPLFYEWKLTQGSNVVAQSNNPSFQFTPLDDANYSVTLEVTDSTESVASRTESLVVHNVRPVLTVAPDQMVDEGSLLDLSAVGAPPLGLFIDDGLLDTHIATVDWGDGSTIESPTIFAAAGSGALGGTHTYTNDGVYEVIVSVTDDDGGSDTQSFFVTVGNVAPTATLSNDGPVDEGASATVSFSGQFDPSIVDTAAGFHYAFDLDNDGTFDVGDGTYAGSGTTDTQMISAALLADGPGTHTVNGRIIDKDGGFTDYSTTITIDNVAPELINIAADDATIDEGQTATIRMTIDDPGAMDVFAVDVDWKDGAPLDTIAGLGMASATGTVGGTTYQWDAQTRELTVSHLYQDDNPTATSSDTYAVALAVRDDDLGATGPYNVDVTVGNVRPVLVVAADQMVGEGALLDLSAVGAPPLALFVDDGVLDTHTATVDWGDGSPLESPTLFPGPGSGTLGATHTYQDNGVYLVTVTVTDDDNDDSGGSDTQSFQVTVGNVAPTAALTNDGPVDEGSTATVSFSGQFDPSSDDTAAGFRYAYDLDNDGTFDVGDGTYAGSVATTSQLVSAALLADGPGTRTVKGRIIDKDGGFTDHTTDVTVDNVRPVLVVATDQLIDEGALLDLSGVGAPPLGLYIDDGILDTHTATVDWGDGSALESPTVFTGPGSGALGATHTFLDNGIYTVTVTVTDDDGGFDTQQFLVTVDNVRPVLVVAADQVINEGTLLDLSSVGAPPLGLYIDDGILDTHTATVDWGDGSTLESPTIFAGPGSGALGATHTYTDDGIYTVTVTVTDDDGGFDTKQFLVTVDNVAPTATLSNNGPVDEGSSATVTFSGQFDPSTTDTTAGFRYAYDLDNNGTFDVGDGTYAGSVATTSQLVSAAFLADGPSTHTVKGRIVDKDGGFTDYTTTITINNVAPELVNIAVDDATINEGQTATITMTIDDPGTLDTFEVDVDWKDGGPIDTIPGLGATDASGTVGGTTYEWDAQTRQLTVSHLYPDDNPTGTASDPYTVVLAVRDDDLGATGPYNVDIMVANVRPVLVVAVDQIVNEGALLDLSAIGAPPLALFIDDGVLDTHVATVNWGDGSAVQMPVIFFANGSGALGASHTYADDGDYTVTVTVTDDDGGFDTQMFLVTVANVDPSIDTLVITTPINEGQTATLSGTYSDPGVLDTHELDVDWDGDNVVDQTVIVSGGSFSVDHLFPDDNPTGTPSDTFTVDVHLRDDDGGSDTAGVDLTVNNVRPVLVVAPDQTVNEGALLDLSAMGAPPLALFVDDGVLDTHTVTVNWGDGTGDQPATLIGGAGSFAVGGTHTYVDDGIFTVTVTVVDDDLGSDTQSFQVTVLNVAPTLVNVGTTDDSINEGASAEIVATINDPGAIDIFSVDVDWHDGGPVDTVTGLGLTDTSGTVGSTGYVWDADTRQLTVTHLYQDDNPTATSSDPYTVTLFVRDDDLAQTGPYNVDITVSNVRPVLVVAPDQTIDEGAELDLTAIGAPPLGLIIDEGKLDTHTATVNWGDGSADQPVTLLGASGSFALGASKHIYADNGVYTVTVSVTDDDGGSDTQTFLVNVVNVEPTLVLTNQSFTINEGQTLSIPNLGTFTDPGFNNPLNPLKQPGGSVETFTYTIQWGDGETDTGLLPTTLVNGAEGVLTMGTLQNLSHFYADNDTIGVVDNKYTITVTLTDDDGGVEVQTIEITVLNVNPTLQPIFATDINANTGTTTLTLSFSDPGADTFQIMVDWGDNLGVPNPADRFEVEQLYDGPTPNTFVIIHQYAGPPDPLNPTADIVISVKIRDDDFATAGIIEPGESNVETVAISNPGIQTNNVAIDTTPDVPRLDLTQQPMVEVFISDQGGAGQLFQVPDVRGGGGEVAATTERYLELRIVYPDGTESEGFRIKDEALADLRAFFQTLPDGRYAIYLVRTENHSERLVIEVDVRHGRVIDVSDDSEGTRDRPPTGEEETPQTVPLDQNPLLEAVPAGEGQGELETRRQGERAEIGDNGDQRVSLSPPLLVSLSTMAAALAAQPWSRRVDAALAGADETAWRRLRRAGRTGRAGRLPRLGTPPLMQTAVNLDYNRN